ncbi:MAG: tetratricopeptide repeat protein [Elusimicrobiota bacterium]
MREILKTWKTTWLGLMIAGLVFSAYLPALRGGFIWDDDRHVSANAAVIDPAGLGRIWRVGNTPQYYPIVFSAFWFQHRVWGGRAEGYHAVNAALHAVNALLIYLLVLRLGFRGAALAALLFALHPVQAETVAWISELKNILSTFFFLLAALSWLEYEDRGGRRWYAGAAVLYLLALLSKTTTCVFPVALLLLRWMRGRRIDAAFLRELAPFIAFGAAFGAHTISVESALERAVGPEYDLTFLQRLLISGRAAWFYLGKLVVPANLSFAYERWNVDPAYAVHWLGLAGLAAGAWGLRRLASRELAAAAAFYLAALVPALGFFKIYPQRYSFVADHFQYLACIGPFVAAGVLASRAVGHLERSNRRLLLVFAAAALWIGARARAAAFRSEEAVWTDAAVKQPGAYIAQLNLGKILADQGRYGEAFARYEATLKLKPGLPEAYVNMGNALLVAGRHEQAILRYRQALAGGARPAVARSARNNLGVALANLKRWKEAAGVYREALRARPDDREARANLCAVLAEKKDAAELRRFGCSPRP